MTLDEERLELVRRTANFAATDAARALRIAKVALWIAIAAAIVEYALR